MKKLTTLMIGAMALSLTATAADYTVTPAEGYQKLINNGVTITFDAEVALTEAAPANATVSFNVGGTKPIMNFNAGAPLSAKGNDLIIGLRSASYPIKVGATKVFNSMSSSPGATIIEDPSVMYYEIPGTAYTVGGQPGQDLKINYTIVSEIPVGPSFDYTVSPEEGWPGASLANFTVTFEGKVEYIGNINNKQVSVSYKSQKGTDGIYTSTSKITVTPDGKTLTVKANKAMAVGTSACFGTVSPAIEEGDMVFTFPEGSYTVDGETGPEFTVTYYMSKEDPNAKPATPVMTVTPAIDSTVPSLPTVKISFGEGFTPAWVESAITAGTVEWSLTGNPSIYTNVGKFNTPNDKYTASTYSVEDNALVITLPNGGLAPGKYTFSLNNKFTVNGEKLETKDFSINVSEPAAADLKEFEYTVDPNPAAVQSQLKTLTLTFAEGANVQYAWPYKAGVRFSRESAEAAATATNNWFANDWSFGGCYAEGNKLVVANSASSGLAVDTSNPWVYIYFADGSFYVDGKPNKAFTLSYYLGEAPDYFYYEADPVEETEVETLDKVSLDFYNVIDGAVMTLTEGVTGTVNHNGATLEGVTVAIDNLRIDDDELVWVDVTVTPAQTLPGSYEIVIPAGALTVTDNALKLGSPELKLPYSIAYATAEYTPEPADNTEMKKLYQVNVTFGEEDVVTLPATPAALAAEEEATTATTAEAKVLLWLGEDKQKASVDAIYTADKNLLKVELKNPREAYLNAENEPQQEGPVEFEIPDGSYLINGVPGAAINLNYTLAVNAEDVNVSVATIQATMGTVTVYDALGRLILKDADSKQLKALKGFYIVNGHKVMLK